MKRNLILSGAVAHDYAKTSPMLEDIPVETGIASEIHEDFSILETDLSGRFFLRVAVGSYKVGARGEFDRPESRALVPT
jgi:hypothetical protein